VEGWGLHLLASLQPIGHFTASELAARLPVAAQDDLLAWGPHGTAVEQFEAVVSREREVDWASLARRAAPLTDNRPINEYYLVRRLMDRRAGPG
jgi:hypothetical protein